MYRFLFAALVGPAGCVVAGPPGTTEPGDATRHGPASVVDWSEVAPIPPSSFSSAKTKALGEVYAEHRITLYCGCAYNEDKSLDPADCGYVPRNDNVRAHRIEWEHIVPASAFGSHRPCWTDDVCEDTSGDGFHGRACCASIDEEFKRMKSELQNLAPAVGELNGDRSDRPYGEVAGEPRAYGDCDFEVDFDSDVAEPAESIRGDVARAYLYMHFVYGEAALPLSDAEVTRFTESHREDLPDDWERIRNERIAGIQGVGNPLVE